MAEDFDPNAFLNLKAEEQEFDPNAFLSLKANPDEPLADDRDLVDKGLDFAKENIAEPVLSTIAPIAQTVDKVTGQPFRSAVSSGISALRGTQSIEDPTGKDIVKQLGVSDASLSDLLPGLFTEDDKESREWLKFKKGGAADISASGAAGLATDMLLDLTTYTGLGALSKGAQALKKTAGATLKPAATTAGKVLAPIGKVGSELLEKTPLTRTIKSGTRGVLESIQDVKSELSAPVRDKFIEQAEFIAKEGGDPTLLSYGHRYGPESYQARAQKAEIQGPLGKSFRDQYEKGVKQANEIFDKKIKEISGGDVPFTTEEAGKALKETYNKSVDDFFNQMDFSYKSVASQAPGMPVDKVILKDLSKKLDNIKKDAAKLASAPTPGSETQARYVLRDIDKLKAKINKGVKYEDLVDDLNRIGDNAFKELKRGVGDIGQNKGLYKDMYGAIRESAIGTVRSKLGDDIADSLVKNNEQFTKFFNERKPIVDLFDDSTLDNSTLYKKVIESGDLTKLRALKEVVKSDPTALNKMKGTFIDQMKETLDGGSYNYGTLQKKLLEDDKTLRIVNELFAPQEIEALKKSIEIGSEYGPNRLNPSRTQELSSFQKIKEELLNVGPRRYVLEASTQTSKEIDDALRALYGEKTSTQIADGMLPKGMSAAKEELSLGEVLQRQREAAAIEKEMLEKQAVSTSIGLDFVPTKSKLIRSGTVQTLKLLDPYEVEEAKKQVQTNTTLDSITRAKTMTSLNKSNEIPVIKPYAPVNLEEYIRKNNVLMPSNKQREPSY